MHGKGKKHDEDDAKLTPREDTPKPKKDQPAPFSAQPNIGQHPSKQSAKDKEDVGGPRDPKEFKLTEAKHPAPAHAPVTDENGWFPGPLPSGTFGFGGVVPVGEGSFRFADFCGDHVKCCPGGMVLLPDMVAFYNNCLTLPPGAPQGTLRTE